MKRLQQRKRGGKRTVSLTGQSRGHGEFSPDVFSGSSQFVADVAGAYKRHTESSYTKQI